MSINCPMRLSAGQKSKNALFQTELPHFHVMQRELNSPTRFFAALRKVLILV